MAPTLAELIAEARALQAQVAEGHADLDDVRERAEALRAEIRKARRSLRRPEQQVEDPEDGR